MIGNGDKRTDCIFKEKCYRKNPYHFKEYKHPHLVELLLKHPDYQVINDTGIGLSNIREQLKVFSDIENLFKRKNQAVVDPINTKNDRTEARKPIIDQVNNQAGKTEARKPTVDPLRTGDDRNEARKRSRSPSAESQKKRKTVESSEGTGGESDMATTRAPASSVAEKLKNAAPFNLFLTKVKNNPKTHNDKYSIYMTDLLHPSLGKLKSSLQINFMVRLDWLMMNYEATNNDKLPLVILYGEENPELASSKLQSNIRTARIKPKYPYGTHHTKMMVLVYDDDSVRVVVHTANLIESDWENRTQGVWVSPRCGKLDSGSTNKGESPTGFKNSLLKYLQFYEVSVVNQFMTAISNCDMSAVNVFFVSSVPNSHKNADVYKWGHKAVAKILRQNVPEDVKRWPVKIQCSSIGSLGQTPDLWLENELGRSLSCHQGASGVSPTEKVEVIYPSHKNVVASYEGLLGGGCLPYSRKTHAKQPWLIDHMHQWKADASQRTKAMPHIKTYTRVDKNGENMAYFLLTSANLSKAAWGSMNKAGNSCLIMSYEAGVLFLPKFITGKDYFEVSEFYSRPDQSQHFPLHYNLPLTKYSDEDTPWFYDALLS